MKKLRDLSREDRHTLGALVFLLVVCLLVYAKEAFADPPPPSGFLAVAFVYQSGADVGAQIMGKAPSMLACLKAAQEEVGKYMEGPHEAGITINVACVPIPPPPDPNLFKPGIDLTKPATKL